MKDHQESKGSIEINPSDDLEVTPVNDPISLKSLGPGPFGSGEGLEGDCTRAD